MVKVRVAGPNTPAEDSELERWQREWTSSAKRLPNGNVQLDLHEEVLAKLEKMRRPGEDDDHLIRRLLDSMATPVDNSNRRTVFNGRR